MTRLLLKKYAHESFLLFAACGSMILVFCWVRIWIVSQFELQRFEIFLDQLRPLERFMPVPLDQVLTYAGSIALTFDEPVLILCVLVWSIARGSDVVSGELGRGTMEMLLAQPISRAGLLACHGVVSIVGLALLCGLAWLGIALGISSNRVKESIPTFRFDLPILNIPIELGSGKTVLVPLADRVETTLFVPAALNLFALGFFMLALSVLLSCVDRYRWRTIGVVIGIYVVQLLTFLLGKASPATEWLLRITFFSLYQPDAIVHFIDRHPGHAWSILWSSEDLGMLGPLGLTLALVGFGSIFYVAASVVFVRRDLPAPL